MSRARTQVDERKLVEVQEVEWHDSYDSTALSAVLRLLLDESEPENDA